jgi:phage-related holin
MGSFFAPITSALVTAIVVVILDTVTKVMVVGKTKGIKEIKSKKLFKIVPKLIFYFIFIILAELLHDYVDVQVPFSKLTIVAIIGIEVYSIDENFEELTGFSFIKKVLEFMKKATQYKAPK